jgi:hypothetical protein
MSADDASAPTGDPSFYGNANPESTSGLATRRTAPRRGPSIPPDRAAEYLGRYRIVVPTEPDTDVLVTVVNDGGPGEDHWSLMAQVGDYALYKLVLVAPDSFVYQLDPNRHVVFVRRDGTVRALELSWRGRVHRGDRVAGTARE